MDILSFILYSDFGIFKKPDVNVNYLTYEFIPKPMVLGILGAIAGFRGYSKQEEIPEYYRKLGNLRIGIQPLELKSSAGPPYSPKDFYPRESSLQKTFVTYNNYHGYGSYELGGNLIVKEQLLLQPAYRIFMEKGSCDTKHYEILKENLERTVSTYAPYMGKNEFFLRILLEGEKTAKKLDDTKTKIATLFFNEIIKEDVIIAEAPGPVRFYNIYEEYPYKLENSHYRFKKVIYSNRKFEVNLSLVEKNNYLAVKVDGSTVFLF